MSEKFSLSNFFGMNEENNDSENVHSDNYNSHKIVGLNSAKKIRGTVSVFEPRIFADSKTIVNKISNGDTVIIKFKDSSNDSVNRIIDFINGAVYALNGNMKKIEDNIFLCTPQGFDIDGDLNSNFDGILS
ncbi:cell division protein SepF [Lactobacillus sp. S2-2]|uniref:cell division protein SepF n=1 Tax=Lactobacillus sp. S2-2 TaxID=2692917 RepID=UPI001F41958C|nr:cell division protein SepF [Lactobacillus sp. S2-2]MCF6514859.1 cell division protein SepF [Lactobacillus sp. S2-2]